MKAIVLADQHWGISDYYTTTDIPENLERFNEIIKHKVVIMGRRTFGDMNRIPIRDVTNVVISSSLFTGVGKCIEYRTTKDVFCINILDNGVIVIRDINFVPFLHKFLGVSTDDIFVIGGAEIYKQLIPLCDEVFVTQFQASVSITPDKYCENLYKSTDWVLTVYGEFMRSVNSNIQYRYDTYKKAELCTTSDDLSSTVPYSYELAIRNKKPDQPSVREKLIYNINRHISLESEKKDLEHYKISPIYIYDYPVSKMPEIQNMYKREGYDFKYTILPEFIEINIKW